MLAGVDPNTSGLPLTDLIYLAIALVGAIGAFVAVPMFWFFAKDRQKVLLRQEVSDEARRRQQLEVESAEKTKQIDRLLSELSDEKKKTDVSGIASTLAHVASTLNDVVHANAAILTKLASVNGSFDRVMERLDASTKAVEAQTEAVKFLAGQVVVNDPAFKQKT